MKRCYLLLLILLPFCMKAQLTGLLEIGMGAQGKSIFYDYGSAVGHTFKDNRTFLYGGLKMQQYQIVPLHEVRGEEVDYVGQTTKAYNFSLFIGGRYSVSLLKFNEKSSFERLGFFPECRLYFSPLLPYSLSYEDQDGNMIELKGDKISQLGYGLGGGIFIGSINEGYIAIKFEVNTIDMIKSLRNLDIKANAHEFSEGQQYLFTLSFYLR